MSNPDLEFGTLRFYNRSTKRGILEVEGSQQQEFDASELEDLQAKIDEKLGDVESWETVSVLQKKPVEVAFRRFPSVLQVARNIEFLD